MARCLRGVSSDAYRSGGAFPESSDYRDISFGWTCQYESFGSGHQGKGKAGDAGTKLHELPVDRQDDRVQDRDREAVILIAFGGIGFQESLLRSEYGSTLRYFRSRRRFYCVLWGNRPADGGSCYPCDEEKLQ